MATHCSILFGRIPWTEKPSDISDADKAQKIDCYAQCKPNMAMIAREVIWQYKQYLKEKKNA